ncbi:S-adenosyl-L-methionine-dependent methyltransferase [Linnemannia elongata]|nr:S-adenosyl-L-methionine-dependent methyltransferase [Linnemannia elongata]
MPAQTVKSMVDYNNKATIQCKVAANLLKYIIEAARNLPRLSSDQCVRVLENACSHGVNSVDFALAVCQAAANRDPSATVSFIFNDLPDNDFDKVVALVSNSAVADFNPTLHTLGKSMYSPLTKPGTLDLVANQAREDFAAYVSSRHQELRQGGKLAVSFPGVPDGQSGMNSCFPDDFKRVHEIVAERGAASLAWMQKYCNGPTYSRNRTEVVSAFSDADWTVDVMELQTLKSLVLPTIEQDESRWTLLLLALRTCFPRFSTARLQSPLISVATEDTEGAPESRRCLNYSPVRDTNGLPDDNALQFLENLGRLCLP